MRRKQEPVNWKNGRGAGERWGVGPHGSVAEGVCLQLAGCHSYIGAGKAAMRIPILCCLQCDSLQGIIGECGDDFGRSLVSVMALPDEYPLIAKDAMNGAQPEGAKMVERDERAICPAPQFGFGVDQRVTSELAVIRPRSSLTVMMHTHLGTQRPWLSARTYSLR
jgi:hypothetical protein